jgi:hypothetical protein
MTTEAVVDVLRKALDFVKSHEWESDDVHPQFCGSCSATIRRGVLEPHREDCAWAKLAVDMEQQIWELEHASQSAVSSVARIPLGPDGEAAYRSEPGGGL